MSWPNLRPLNHSSPARDAQSAPLPARHLGQGGQFLHLALFADQAFGPGLQLTPPFVLQHGSTGNQGEQAFPLHADPLRATWFQLLALGKERPPVTQNFRCPFAVFERKPSFQVTGTILESERLTTNQTDSGLGLGQGAKTMPGPQVGQVIDKFLDRIVGILQGNRNGQTLAS